MVRVQELTVGQVYRNRNGWDYLCLENAGPGVAVLERVSDGWTLLAHGICVYEDGSIEWDRSTWGHWPDGRRERWWANERGGNRHNRGEPRGTEHHRRRGVWVRVHAEPGRGLI